MIIKICLQCGKEFSKSYNKSKQQWLKRKFCSYKCYWENIKGEKGSNYQGGITYRSGYKFILSPNHPFKNGTGYVNQSRLIVEKHLNRYLTKSEIIHHINGIKNDNRLKNLYLFISNSKHIKFHRNPYFLTSNLL